MCDEGERLTTTGAARDFAAYTEARNHFLATLRADAEIRRLETAWTLTLEGARAAARPSERSSSQPSVAPPRYQ
jgi:hypothetical protein